MTAARHALPSRQYGLRVKCGLAEMQATAVGRKVGAAVPPLHGGGRAEYPSNNVTWAEASPLCTRWYLDLSSRYGITDMGQKAGSHFQSPKILGRPQPLNNKCYR